MTKTRFGRLSVKDPRLVGDLMRDANPDRRQSRGSRNSWRITTLASEGKIDMTGDIVDRLRAEANLGVGWSASEAADEIEKLRARIAGLEGDEEWQTLDTLSQLPMTTRVFAYWPQYKIISLCNVRHITCLRVKDRPSHWRPMLLRPPEEASAIEK